MKVLPLTRGKVALVDDDDFEILSKHKWRAGKTTQRAYTFYASRCVNRIGQERKEIFMHRVILNVPIGMIVDHINRDGLDNRKENLRICTRAQNTRNSKISTKNKTGYKGVHFDKRPARTKKWVAVIGFQGKTIYLGAFKQKEEAALAYNKAAIKFFGEFAAPNML